jgi:hypothetical protein
LECSGGWSCHDRSLNPAATASLPASLLQSVFGAARSESDSGRGVERPNHSSVGGLGSEPDNSVSDVVEIRCADRSGPARREHRSPQSRTSEGGIPAADSSVWVVGRGCRDMGSIVGRIRHARSRSALRAPGESEVGRGWKRSDRSGLDVRGERGRLGLADASVSSIGIHARRVDPRSVSGATRLGFGGRARDRLREVGRFEVC